MIARRATVLGMAALIESCCVPWLSLEQHTGLELYKHARHSGVRRALEAEHPPETLMRFFQSAQARDKQVWTPSPDLTPVAVPLLLDTIYQIGAGRSSTAFTVDLPLCRCRLEPRLVLG